MMRSPWCAMSRELYRVHRDVAHMMHLYASLLLCPILVLQVQHENS